MNALGNDAAYVYVMAMESPRRAVVKIGKTIDPAQRLTVHNSRFRELGCDTRGETRCTVLGFDSIRAAELAERVLQRHEFMRTYRLNHYNNEWFVADWEDGEQVLRLFLTLEIPKLRRTLSYAGYPCSQYLSYWRYLSEAPEADRSRRAAYLPDLFFINKVVPEPDPVWLAEVARTERFLGMVPERHTAVPTP